MYSDFYIITIIGGREHEWSRTISLTKSKTNGRKKWNESRIFQAEPDKREKFFITIPYPYLNGNLHAGHTRTFTIGDVVARHKRMLGYNVLYPMASM